MTPHELRAAYRIRVARRATVVTARVLVTKDAITFVDGAQRTVFSHATFTHEGWSLTEAGAWQAAARAGRTVQSLARTMTNAADRFVARVTEGRARARANRR